MGMVAATLPSTGHHWSRLNPQSQVGFYFASPKFIYFYRGSHRRISQFLSVIKHSSFSMTENGSYNVTFLMNEDTLVWRPGFTGVTRQSWWYYFDCEKDVEQISLCSLWIIYLHDVNLAHMNKLGSDRADPGLTKELRDLKSILASVMGDRSPERRTI